MTHTIEGTWDEIQTHAAALEGHRLRVIIDPEDEDYGAPAHLIVRDEAHLKELLLAGLNSGPAIPVTEEFWAEMHQMIDQRAGL
jgi:hypothetical protein